MKPLKVPHGTARALRRRDMAKFNLERERRLQRESQGLLEVNGKPVSPATALAALKH